MISNAWVTRSTSRHGAFSRGRPGGYGYLWWLSKENYKTGQVDVIRADGNGGQYIFIVPRSTWWPCSPARTTTRTRRFALSAADDLRPGAVRQWSLRRLCRRGLRCQGWRPRGAPRRLSGVSGCGLGVIGDLRLAFAPVLLFLLLGEFALSLLEGNWAWPRELSVV